MGCHKLWRNTATHLEHYFDEFWLIILSKLPQNEFADILEIYNTLLFNLQHKLWALFTAQNKIWPHWSYPAAPAPRDSCPHSSCMTADPGESVLILSQTKSFNGPMCNENILCSCEHFLFAGNVSLFNLLISSVLVERQSLEGEGEMIAASFSGSVLCHHSVPQWNFKLS